jgi:hypothetical protein
MATLSAPNILNIGTTAFNAYNWGDLNGATVLNSGGQIIATISSMGPAATIAAAPGLLSLSATGVSSVTTGSTSTGTTDATGNTQLATGTFTKTDGTTGLASDYSLVRDVVHSCSIGQVETAYWHC